MSEWDIITLDQRSDWEAAVAAFDHDVYHRWEYHQLAFENGEGDPVLITWGKGRRGAAMPLLVRPIPDSDGRLDASSVYGYPGPLYNGATEIGFGEPLRDALQELGLVSAFSRMNPFLDTSHALRGVGSIARLGPTVSLDLALDGDQRWAAYSRSTRRRILRLERSGAEVFVDDDLVHLDNFGSMHAAAMQRVGADESYAFDAQYFRRLHALLNGSVRLMVCKLGDDLLAAGLYLCSGDIVQAHLAADDPQARYLAPQRLEIHGAARVFADRGFRRLHLGGGVGSREDSLLAFKRGFGGHETQFSIWRHVVDPDAYRSLCAARPGPVTEEDHFPAYRSLERVQTPRVGSK